MFASTRGPPRGEVGWGDAPRLNGRVPAPSKSTSPHSRGSPTANSWGRTRPIQTGCVPLPDPPPPRTSGEGERPLQPLPPLVDDPVGCTSPHWTRLPIGTGSKRKPAPEAWVRSTGRSICTPHERVALKVLQKSEGALARALQPGGRAAGRARPPGDRPLRRARGHRRRRALPGHGVAGGRDPGGAAAQGARRPARDARGWDAACWRGWRSPTARGSSTATSSRRTSSCHGGDLGQVKVLDFGIARRMFDGQADHAGGRDAGHAHVHVARAGARRARASTRARTCSRWAACCSSA